MFIRNPQRLATGGLLRAARPRAASERLAGVKKKVGAEGSAGCNTVAVAASARSLARLL